MVDSPQWKKSGSPDTPPDSMVDRLPGGPLFLVGTFPFDVTYPVVDISERNSVITLHAEIPGIDKEHIEVTLTGGRFITIKGEKRFERQFRDEEFFRAERAFGKFQRVLELPGHVDESRIEATYRRGVLKIRMHRTDRNAKHVPVKNQMKR